tara:strand:+ start:293 stop:403 length:111 start_codon:yes stop_codon:yes gene_type:complete
MMVGREMLLIQVILAAVVELVLLVLVLTQIIPLLAV